MLTVEEVKKRHKEAMVRYKEKNSERFKELQKIRSQRWKANSPEGYKACVVRNKLGRNLEKVHNGNVRRYAATKLKVLQHYGKRKVPKCVLCGNTDIDVLCLDHIKGKGNKQRAKLAQTGNSNFYNWAVKNNFPKGVGLRVLCLNCNHKVFRYLLTQKDKKYSEYRTMRAEALLVYGGIAPTCKCCGESDTDILCFDHIHNDGASHRKIVRGPLVRWLKKNAYPEGYQLLCHNCNWKKEKNRRKFESEKKFKK